MDCSPPGSSVHGILQVRVLEQVAMPFSRGSSQPRDQSQVSCTACGFWALELQGNQFLLFEATKFVMTCRSSHRKSIKGAALGRGFGGLLAQ